MSGQDRSHVYAQATLRAQKVDLAADKAEVFFAQGFDSAEATVAVRGGQGGPLEAGPR